MAVAVCGRDKLQMTGDFRYRKARRPELYRDVIGMAHDYTGRRLDGRQVACLNSGVLGHTLHVRYLGHLVVR